MLELGFVQNYNGGMNGVYHVVSSKYLRWLLDRAGNFVQKC